MVLIYSRDMLWYQNRLLMVLFDDTHFLPKMRIEMNLLAKTNMGSISTPRPNQRHQICILFLAKQALHRLCSKDFVLLAFELWRALAKVLCSCAELRRAGFWVAMGFYGHVKSRYTFWGHLGPFPQLRQISPELATSSGNRKPRQVNRITAQVLVCRSPPIATEAEHHFPQ